MRSHKKDARNGEAQQQAQSKHGPQQSPICQVTTAVNCEYPCVLPGLCNACLIVDI